MVVFLVLYMIYCLDTEQQQLTSLYWEWSEYMKVKLQHKQTLYNLVDNFLKPLCVWASLHGINTHMVFSTW